MFPTPQTSLSVPGKPTAKSVRLPFYGLVAGVFLWHPASWAQSFEMALGSCAQQVRFCEKESYNSDLCKEVTATLTPCDTAMTAGTLCVLKLKDVVPTQPSVGRHVAECKAKRLQTKGQEDGFKKGLTRYLFRAKRHVPTVIGPENKDGGRYYITDHHHLSYAMNVAHSEGRIDSDQDHVTACILTNRSADKKGSFWSYMIDNHFAWLDNAEGSAITTAELRDKYTSIDKLDNYPYRSWSRWVRDSCGYVKKGNDCVPVAYPGTDPFFMEFKWADYMHNNLTSELTRQGIVIDLENIMNLSDEDIGKVVKVAIELVQGDQAFLQDLPGYSDGTVIPVKQVSIEKGCEVN